MTGFNYDDPTTWTEEGRESCLAYLRSVLAEGCSPRIKAYVEKKVTMIEEAR